MAKDINVQLYKYQIDFLRKMTHYALGNGMEMKNAEAKMIFHT